MGCLHLQVDSVCKSHWPTESSVVVCFRLKTVCLPMRDMLWPQSLNVDFSILYWIIFVQTFFSNNIFYQLFGHVMSCDHCTWNFQKCPTQKISFQVMLTDDIFGWICGINDALLPIFSHVMNWCQNFIVYICQIICFGRQKFNAIRIEWKVFLTTFGHVMGMKFSDFNSLKDFGYNTVSPGSQKDQNKFKILNKRPMGLDALLI